jgi:hypothetical protein
MAKYERQKEEEEKAKKVVEAAEWKAANEAKKVVAEAAREKAAAELKEKQANLKKKAEEKAVGTCMLPEQEATKLLHLKHKLHKVLGDLEVVVLSDETPSPAGGKHSHRSSMEAGPLTRKPLAKWSKMEVGNKGPCDSCQAKKEEYILLLRGK